MSTTSLYIITMLLNSVFLIIWVIAQYFIAYSISMLKTDAMNNLVLYIFRIIFALSTLVPIVIRFYTDTRKMIIQADKEIKDELKELKN